ncbi:MAG: GlsB/YeaQ/YmgE family stress response membrane protein [Actinomycetota bacterium]|nr:GlsB/YeaQ/YmgE family stress response membrane protein [Actinomycetota bacterium]
MIGTILGAIVVGLIVGALARLVMPGKQNIGLIMTIVLGALGSFVGTWLTYSLGYSNSNGGFEIIPFLVGIIVAVVLIAAYLGITGKRNAQPRA